jgi:hypothetical protein
MRIITTVLHSLFLISLLTISFTSFSKTSSNEDKLSSTQVITSQNDAVSESLNAIVRVESPKGIQHFKQSW